MIQRLENFAYRHFNPIVAVLFLGLLAFNAYVLVN